MMRAAICIHASAERVRHLRQLHRSARYCSSRNSSVFSNRHTASSSLFVSFDVPHRQLSAGSGVGDGLNGKKESPGSGIEDILESTSATTQWKRNHYRKIEDKFPNQEERIEENNAAETTSTEHQQQQQKQQSSRPTPLTIDNYDDVQPMWKEMESRVTRRRSLTLAERGGMSGRRNVRKSDEDVWLEAGVYDSNSDSDIKSN